MVAVLNLPNEDKTLNILKEIVRFRKYVCFLAETVDEQINTLMSVCYIASQEMMNLKTRVQN